MLVGLSEEHLNWLTPTIAIHSEIVTDWNNMVAAAQQDQFDLAIASGFRSFTRQQAIWTNKMTGKLPVLDQNEEPVDISLLSEFELIEAIMLYSALPGGSRHHWGTDIDVYAANLLKPEQPLRLEVSEYEGNGTFSALRHWLDKHAHQFGFYSPYPSYQGGVAAEPWHLSHKRTAITFEQSMNLELLAHVINEKALIGKETLLENIEAIYNRFIRSAFFTNRL